MTTAPVLATPVDPRSGPVRPDPDFAGRWTAWQARGARHDRVVGRRLTVAAIAVGVLVVAAAIAYALMTS